MLYSSAGTWFPSSTLSTDRQTDCDLVLHVCLSYMHACSLEEDHASRSVMGLFAEDAQVHTELAWFDQLYIGEQPECVCLTDYT
jgi:hypothetical protein